MKSSALVVTRKPARTVMLGLALGMALALAGCASDGTTTGMTTGAPGVGVYVIQNTTIAATGTTAATTSGSVLEFSTSASGVSTPIATINGPSGGALDFLAVDGTGDLYTTSQSASTSSIAEYTVGAENNATPSRAIPFNATTGLTALSGLAVDPAGDIYASASAGSVSVFASSATGSVAPTSTVTLPTGSSSQATAVDSSGNIYVATASTSTSTSAPVEVFAPGAATPTRSIGGALTTLGVGSPAALATDTAGNLYVTSNISGVSSILIFDPTATGNTPPLRDITGSNTLLGCIGGIALDTEGYLYVISTPTCGSTASPTVLKFSTTGDGNIAPVSSFTSAAWTNADPTLSIAVY